MTEKYCGLNYRGYLFEIQKKVFEYGIAFDAKCNDYINFSIGDYTNLKDLITYLLEALDMMLGEKEKEIDEGGNYLFCSIIYQDYELKVFLNIEDSSYLAWIDNFYFASWGKWSINRFVSIIDAFKKKVDSGTGKNFIHTFCYHNGHTLVVKKEGELYIGTSYVHGKDWQQQSYDLDFLVRWFKSDVDEFSDKKSHLDNLIEMTEEAGLYEYF